MRALLYSKDLSRNFFTHDVLPNYEVILLATSEFEIMRENKAYLELSNQCVHNFSNAARSPIRNRRNTFFHLGQKVFQCLVSIVFDFFTDVLGICLYILAAS